MNPLFQIPESLADLSDDEISAFIASAQEIAENVAANPAEYVGEERTVGDLMEEMTSGVAAIELARAELATRSQATPADEPDNEINTDELAELAARARGPEETLAATEDQPDETPAPTTDEQIQEAVRAALAAQQQETDTADDPEPITAAIEVATPPRGRLARSRASEPNIDEQRVAMTAAAENLGYGLGEQIPTEMDLARMMIARRRQIGSVPEGTHGDKVTIARADWSGLYSDERRLGWDEDMNRQKVLAVTAGGEIEQRFKERQRAGGSLTASGGLCAPVTPYYNLAMISVADRPVRGALPSFNADRGGIRYARPAALTAITTAIGTKTVAEDANASDAVKTCQVIACPQFIETDVVTIYHCLQFGNLGQRTFPELVAQWNQLVLAAHARAAESLLLTGIDDFSTAVSAGSLGLGASGTLPSQILAAAQGMRSRHRMTPNAVLRVMLPQWVGDLLVSDVYRSQFQRFDMDVAKFVALLRAGNVEPTFYMDSADGAGQVFGAQAAAALDPFPSHVRWYLYPEGSFLYVDGGVLELGLVRDSILNSTNDFQLFGESFENVAFVGVESIAVSTPVCDSGTVSLPHAVTCPINYAP